MSCLKIVKTSGINLLNRCLVLQPEQVQDTKTTKDKVETTQNEGVGHRRFESRYAMMTQSTKKIVCRSRTTYLPTTAYSFILSSLNLVFRSFCVLYLFRLKDEAPV